MIVLDDEPISWNRAYRQIENNTKIGEKIFKLLEELEII